MAVVLTHNNPLWSLGRNSDPLSFCSICVSPNHLHSSSQPTQLLPTIDPCREAFTRVATHPPLPTSSPCAPNQVVKIATVGQDPQHTHPPSPHIPNQLLSLLDFTPVAALSSLLLVSPPSPHWPPHADHGFFGIARTPDHVPLRLGLTLSLVLIRPCSLFGYSVPMTTMPPLSAPLVSLVLATPILVSLFFTVSLSFPWF